MYVLWCHGESDTIYFWLTLLGELFAGEESKGKVPVCFNLRDECGGLLASVEDRCGDVRE